MISAKKIREASEESLCITRQKSGRGFRYFDENKKLIKEKSLLKRLKKLIIPPMWKDVQICKWPDGHIQAVGRDSKGRKQYIYHSIYEQKRQEEKFNRMIDFGLCLPRIRKKAIEFIKGKEWSKEKVIALSVLIIDETGIRIGNRSYLDKNGTYGLTTLRRKHLDIEGNHLTFQYRGKSGKNRVVEIENSDLIKLIKKSAELPGYEIFRYKESSKNYESIDSEDINDFIHQYMDEDFSSKDFRTWAASRLAIELYPEALRIKQAHPRKKFLNILIRLVAEELGNTPTVCRSYYIHPKVLQAIDTQNCPIVNVNVQDNIYDHNLTISEKVLLDILSDK